MDHDLKEQKIPLGLIVAGELILVVAGLIKVGAGVGVLMAFVGVATVVGVLLMLTTAFLAAFLLRVSFGDLWSAVLKLTGIYIFSAALGLTLPSGFAFLLQSAAFVVLMMWLFELELPYVIAFAVLNFVVNLVAGGILAAAVAGVR
ncbi:MAG TPA: hypothetical protein VF796_12450 [Humisphaera sp.]